MYSDQEYSESIGHNTRKGLRGQFLAGFHTGQACFGYRNQPIEDQTRKGDYGRPAIAGVKQVIHPEEAKIVVWMFEACVAGMSCSEIADALIDKRRAPKSSELALLADKRRELCSSAEQSPAHDSFQVGFSTC